jgi:hypothetical protein
MEHERRPVTLGLVSLFIAICMALAPVVAWGATMHGRLTSLEKAEQLRGQQLDRIEAKVDKLVERDLVNTAR